MVDFSNQKEAEAWFSGKEKPVSVVMSARVSLRLIPLLADYLNRRLGAYENKKMNIILATFRRCHLAGISSTYSDKIFDDGKLFRDASDALLEPKRYVSKRSKAYLARSVASIAVRVAGNTEVYALGASSSALIAVRAGYSEHELDLESELLDSGSTANEIGRLPLWHSDAPYYLESQLSSLKSSLLAQNQDWDVWTRWYEARVNGEPSNKDLDLAIATIPNEDWEQGPAHVNKLIKALEDKFAPRANLEAIISAASPSVGLNSLGQLDSIPNPEYDAPRAGKTLPELIVIQRDTLSVLKTLKQAPISVQQMVNNYESELEVRGVKLILGRLENCAYIISRAVADTPAARAWLEAGALAAFEQFTIHHDAIVFAYPKHEQVQKLFDETCINFQSSGLPSIHKEMRKLAETSNQAVKANIVTAGFSGDVVNFGTIINNFSNVHQSAGDAPLKSDEKALWLRTFGWVKKAYEAATTVWKFAQTDEGTALIAILSSLIPHLQALLGF